MQSLWSVDLRRYLAVEKQDVVKVATEGISLETEREDMEELVGRHIREQGEGRVEKLAGDRDEIKI